MSGKASDKLLPEDDSELKWIAEFWNQLAFDNLRDGAIRESLREIERLVSDCIYEAPPDIYRARRLTAQAILLLRSS